MHNLENIDDILKSYDKYIISIVNKYNFSRFDKDDLYQAVLVGLFKAIKRYNESYNVKLSTFAFKYIIGEINKEYTKLNLYGRSDYNKIRNYIKEHSELTIDAISKNLKLSIETIYLAISKCDKVVYLDEIMIDSIVDNNKIVDLEFTKEEEILYNYYFVRKFNQSVIAKLLNTSQPTVSRMIKNLKNKISKTK